MLRIAFVSLFPEMLTGTVGSSILHRASEAGHVRFDFANPRDFCYDRHQKVDDTPFGGEPGMLVKAEPVALAVESLNLQPGAAVVMTDPAGFPFTQGTARELSDYREIVFLCGHYEGIDHRISESLCTHWLSIGDYILTNGELPALVMADAIVRLVPGVLGSAESLAADSHSNGLLGAPNYTRPEVWRGLEVPPVLRSGDHKAVAEWRREQALALTRKRRPDLLAKAPLEAGDVKKLEKLDL